MDIRCIALDLDRTTLDERGRLPEENRRALEAAMARGVHVVIASGRPLGSLPADVLAVPGIEYAVTSNGAAVWQLTPKACIHRLTMTPRSVEVILDLTKNEPVALEIFIRGEAWAAADYVRDPVRYGATPQAIAYIQGTRRPAEDIRTLIRENLGELDSLDLVTGDRALEQRLRTTLRRDVPDLYITSSVPGLIELSHRDGGKHSGVRFVAERLGIPDGAVAAFGDGDNDVDLLTWAGCGIAVANATPACLAAADAVTRDHRENGVAWGIREILHL